MRTRTIELVLAAALMAAGVRWLWNSNPWSGPTVLTLSEGHGVHLHDWLSFVLWYCGASLAIGARLTPAYLVTRRGRRADRR